MHQDFHRLQLLLARMPRRKVPGGASLIYRAPHA